MKEFEKELHSEKFKKYNLSEYLEKELIETFGDWEKPEQLPVIPKFIATKITELKQFGYSILEMFDNSDEEIQTWLFKNKELHSKLIVSAWFGEYRIGEEVFFLKNRITKDYLTSVIDDNGNPKYKDFPEPVTSFTDEEIRKLIIMGDYTRVPVDDV